MNRNYYIAAAGVLAVAAYLFLMRGKGQQFMVENDVVIPVDSSAPVGRVRLTERPTLIPKGDIVMLPAFLWGHGLVFLLLFRAGRAIWSKKEHHEYHLYHLHVH